MTIILKKLREKKGYRVQDLEPLLEVSFGYIYQLERGYKRASVDLIEKYSKIFGYDYDELLTQYIKEYNEVKKIKK